MNILVLNYEYPPLGGGGASVCRDLSKAFVQAGHHVTVVTMGFPGLPDYEDAEGIEIFRVKCLHRKAHACMPWEQYTYIAAARKFLKGHLRSHTYELCHTHFILPTGPVAQWIKKRYDIPYVVTAHGSDVEGYNDKTWNKVMHILLRPFWKKNVQNANAVIAPSGFLMHLLKRSMESDRYRLIPNGLDIGIYQAGPDEKEHRILLMGRMQQSKNIQTILKALADIPDEIWRDWRADVIGDGPYRHKLEQLAEELRITDRVRFFGWIDHESPEHLEYLKRSAIYISASRFENCPMAVLESIAAQCYPLLSDIEGHRQFFKKDAGQYFFPADDARALTSALIEVMQKKAVDEMYLPDIQRFDIRCIAEQYLSLFEEIRGCRDCRLLSR